MKTKLLFFFVWLVLSVTGCSAGEPKRICQVHLRLKNRKNLSNLSGMKKC